MTDAFLSELAAVTGGVATRTVLEAAVKGCVREHFGTDVELDWSRGRPGPVRWLPQLACGSEVATSIIVAAQRSVLLLERVAATSQRGFRRSKTLQERLDSLDVSRAVVAESHAMREVVAQACTVAPYPTTVLITGESGTGKEVIARLIHDQSPRRNRPYLAVNCAAIPQDLVETLLLGHERGAFSGATGRHQGFVERAGKGTLLLDEVGELPLGTQVKLLRLLQEREFERVGGTTTLRAQCRFLAATNRPLDELMALGLFREDLFYRLNVFPIALSPLRARPEDTVALAELIVGRIAARHARSPPRIGAAQLARLVQHSWPGNVRELENVLERALILYPGEELILPPDWPRRVGRQDSASGRTETLDEAMRACIDHALRRAGGKIYGVDGAASAVGLKPSTLQWKMKRLGLRRQDYR